MRVVTRGFKQHSANLQVRAEKSAPRSASRQRSPCSKPQPSLRFQLSSSLSPSLAPGHRIPAAVALIAFNRARQQRRDPRPIVNHSQSQRISLAQPSFSDHFRVTPPRTSQGTIPHHDPPAHKSAPVLHNTRAFSLHEIGKIEIKDDERLKKNLPLPQEDESDSGSDQSGSTTPTTLSRTNSQVSLNTLNSDEMRDRSGRFSNWNWSFLKSKDWWWKLGKRWTVFGITGTTTMYLVKPLLSSVFGLQGSLFGGPPSYVIAYVFLMMPAYSIILLTVGTLAREHKFFKKIALRMWGWLLPKSWTQEDEPPSPLPSKRNNNNSSWGAAPPLT